MESIEPSVVVIGAGPAGLTAASVLAGAGVKVSVIERDANHVGGIARTVSYKGFRFDLGGHRFFSKAAEVEAFWTALLGDDMLERPRKSRIYYRGKLFDYPLNVRDALRKLGLGEAAACVLSYLGQRVRPARTPRNFEEWMTARFGRRLFRIFFKTYTEKVWGMKCSEISADWAAQRINDLSLLRAVRHALFPPKAKATIKTLIDRFRYPRLGPGMMWDAAARKLRQDGGELVMGVEAAEFDYDAPSRRWTVRGTDEAGRTIERSATQVISSMALGELVPRLIPAAPAAMRDAAAALRYRDFLVVGLIVEDDGRFDDTWLYIHDPAVKVGRIQNLKAWSKDLVPDPRLNGYGLEYFCNEGDALWQSSDADLVALARQELVTLGLADDVQIRDGTVIRQKKAYPVYDETYAAHVATIRDGLARDYPGLHLVGRNGMHKYNNQDHAMMTAMLTARNILLGREAYDVWAVNQDALYHESGGTVVASAPTIVERLVPRKVAS